MDFKKMTDAFEVARAIENGTINVKEMVTIAHKAQDFSSSIVLHTGNKIVDVKSFLGLSMSLMTSTHYKLEIHGDDEEEAKKAMKDVFEKYGMKVEIV
ncbi:HPr family phosphocarrier protein [Ammoniphilus sp. YIM 78166]|uniref:HPr family phosphocarrier protein n=1 Tax=Ammoniphilus sp. YIM 78166 TaxID=1644106 RepID=UPI0035156CCA